MEGVYSRAGKLGKEGVFGKCKEISGRVQKKDKCRNKKTGEVGLSRRKGL